MKQKKNNNKTLQRVLIIGLSLLLVLSSFSFFNSNSNTETTSMNVYIQFMVDEQTFQPESYEVYENITLYSLLNGIGASFEQDGDLKCIGSYCNSFSTHNYWQVFVNNEPVSDFSKIIQSEDLITLYFGQRIVFYNITLNSNITGYYQTGEVTIQEGVRIIDIINSYNATFINNTINCMFGYCNNENFTWSINVNNESVNSFNSSLLENDVLSIIFD